MYDTTTPLVNIAGPVDGSMVNSFTVVVGTAADLGNHPSTLNKVEVRIQDLTYSTTYWNGSAWISVSSC